MHPVDLVCKCSRAKRVRILGPLVNITEGHLLGQLLLAFGDKLVVCLSLEERRVWPQT